MGRERRAHPRYPCELEIHIAGRDGSYALTTRDVSLGGVFVFAREPLPLNQHVDLLFQAAELQLEVSGVVVHHLRNVGFGVQFAELDAVEKARFTGFLEDVEATSAP